MSQQENLQKIYNTKLTIFNIPIGWFLVIIAFTFFAMYTGNLPTGMVGALLLMMVLGEFFGWIGDSTPLLRSYLGGGAIITIFGSAFLMHMNWILEDATLMITDFMQDGGFLIFYIAGLITGSILSINSKVLIKAVTFLLKHSLFGVSTAILIDGIIGALRANGFTHTILMVVLRLTRGDMGLGLVLMLQVHPVTLGTDPRYYISLVGPAIPLGNLFAI